MMIIMIIISITTIMIIIVTIIIIIIIILLFGGDPGEPLGYSDNLAYIPLYYIYPYILQDPLKARILYRRAMILSESAKRQVLADIGAFPRPVPTY